MRKLFFVFCSILAFNICLAQKWWEDNFIIGALWGPPLQYNEDSILTRDFALLENGRFNFIAGKLIPHNNYTDTLLKYHLDSLIQECSGHELYFLNENGNPDTIYGINVKDEPQKGEAHNLLAKVDSIKQSDSTFLGFINLYPIYNFVRDSSGHRIINYEAFTSYVNAFLGNDTLQVASFDNYYPNSNFSPNIRPSKIYNYYANLAYMKHAAGKRPLWSILRSSEKYVEEKDTAWQDAYIRLGAFAPLAFGAKGIIYFSYDCRDRNKIRRAPSRGSWKGHDMYFDNDEKSRQIFFGNFKYNTNNVPDLAIHTNDSGGTWYIKETLDDWIESDSNPLIKIGTWFGDHVNNMPNIYNWDFASDGRDKFTTITRDGRLLLSKFRSGWTHKAIIDIPWSCWSSMTRFTCPFADFNKNLKLDLCLGWTENGHGKLRICMDCEENAVQDPSTTITDMSFANTSQVFTFSDSIKQVFTRNDSIWVITSNPSSSSSQILDKLYVLKYGSGLFNAVDTLDILLSKKIEHYWMEDSLYGQDSEGKIWQGVYGNPYDLTREREHYYSHDQYVWGQYNKMTHNYDIFSIAPEERYNFQTYALLDRKGRPNRIYQTAKNINQFINDSINYIGNDTISSIILDGEWKGAYFTSAPSQTRLESLNIIKNSDTNPPPLISKGFAIENGVLFGLYKEENGDLDLIVINMREYSQNIIFTIDRHIQLPQISSYTYHCDRITRMHPAVSSKQDVYTYYTTIELQDMLGGECAVLHLSKNTSQ